MKCSFSITIGGIGLHWLLVFGLYAPFVPVLAHRQDPQKHTSQRCMQEGSSVWRVPTAHCTHQHASKQRRYHANAAVQHV
jgi:hypothetical protein